MNYSLQVFGAREAFVKPYRVPTTDVSADNGTLGGKPPTKPVVVAIEPTKVTYQPGPVGTVHNLYKWESGEFGGFVFAGTDPDNTGEILSVAVSAPGMFVVVAENAFGMSPPSNALYLEGTGLIPEPPPILVDGVDTTSLPAAPLYLSYACQLSVELGWDGPYRWHILSGALPVGIYLNADTGLISGNFTPAPPSPFGAITIQVSTPFWVSTKVFPSGLPHP